MQKDIKYREKEFMVLLEEEYGYKHWFWFPQMTPFELEAWWKKLDTVDPYFMTPEPLPGDVIFAEDMEHWYSLQEKGKHYQAHIHCDDDSWLMRSLEKYVYHMGYEGEK
ncbi:hypothetical protein ACJJJB_03015 [Microbulbifer sp. ANSA001]|uniref:hypothetical protein n=1 Tax=Microbulbifer sp. ANSA001 TaxID=3243358 RepID=UPI00404332F6